MGNQTNKPDEGRSSLPATGKVILVGAGPGDPDLITVRGMKAIQSAEVLVYDYLANPLLLREAPTGAERLYVGKRAGHHSSTQDEINALLVQKAGKEGRRVVRLKGGDPYVFGRGGEEISVLREHGIDFEVIPGLPAAVGMGAYAGIPLTDRRHCSQVTFVTGNEDPTKAETSVDWEHIAKFGGTIVVYMGVRNLPKIAEALLGHGMDPSTPVGLIEWATTPKQRVVSGELASIARTAEENSVKAPALIVIGHVNDLRDELKWFEARPLFGKQIVVTRSRSQASRLTEQLQLLGAGVIEMPVIDIQPTDSTDKLDAAIANLSDYNWIVFTSVNGIDAFMVRLRAAGRDARALAGIRIATIGSATTERLTANGLSTDLQPPKFTGKTIYEELAKVEDLQGKRILMPRANIANPELRVLCTEAGAEVDDIAAYQTVPGDFDSELLRNMIENGEIDGITFTSSSTVRFFVDGLGADFVAKHAPDIAALSIGPVTSATMRELGLEPATEAESHDIPGLVQATSDFYN